MSDTPVQSAAPAAEAQTPVEKAISEVHGDETEVEAAGEETDETEGDTESTEVEEKVKEEKKKWSLKVGGKQVDIQSEEELVKHAQMGLSAQEKWQEASKIKKEVQDFVSMLQSNTAEALAMMGLDVDKMAEDHIAKRIEEMQKSPEQLAQEKIHKELENLKKEKQDMEARARDAEMARIQEQYAVQIENEITDALTNTKSLPKSPYVVKRIADMMLLALNSGYKDVSVSDVLPVVEKDIRGEIQQMFATMPEELVEAVIGKDVFTRVRKKRLSKGKPAPVTASGVRPTGADTKAQDTDSGKKKISAKDFFKNIGSY